MAVYKKLTEDFKVPFMLEDPYRVEETPKHKAVREAIANCLANADFFQKGGVVIERYPDLIELSNPGTIILGKGQMIHGGLSEPRNKNILKMFNLIGIGDHAGSGVPEIYEVWKAEGLKDSIVEETFGTEIGDRTKVTLPLTSSQSLVTSDEAGDEAKLLSFCSEPKSKTEIREYMGIKTERYIRQKLIMPLLEKGSLLRTIPDKPSSPNQKYIAKK